MQKCQQMLCIPLMHVYFLLFYDSYWAIIEIIQNNMKERHWTMYQLN